MSSSILLHRKTLAQTNLILSSQNLNSIGISGPIGAGKSYFAKYLGEQILNININENSPYVKFIDCANGAGIEQIRDIKTFLQLKVPTENRFSRGVIIENIELLGIPAQNALLKTFEEPPVGTIIIATSANKNSVLPTIVSRLQWINLLPLSKSQLEDALFINVPTEDLEKAFLLSEGNVGKLISLINKDESEAPFIAAIAEAKILLNGTRFEKLAKIDEILKSKDYSLPDLLSAMAKILRSVLIKKSHTSSSTDLIKKLEYIIKAQESLKYNPSNKLLLTTLFNKL